MVDPDCWAHFWSNFSEIYRAHASIAAETLRRIAQIYAMSMRSAAGR
jgi:hypothetical protein